MSDKKLLKKHWIRGEVRVKQQINLKHKLTIFSNGIAKVEYDGNYLGEIIYELKSWVE